MGKQTFLINYQALTELNFLDKLLNHDTEHFSKFDQKKIKLVNLYSLLGVLSCVLYMVIFYVNGDYPLVILDVLAILAFFYGRSVCLNNNIQKGYIISYLSSTMVLFITDIYFGGMIGTSLFYYPLIATSFTIIRLDDKRVLFSLIAFPLLLFVASLAIFRWWYIGPTVLGNSMYPTIYLNSWINVAILLVAIIFYFLRVNISTEKFLSDSKKEAEAASIAKSEFLSTMSHEIRTPLNAVIGLSHLLQVNKPRDDQKEFLNSLEFSASYLLGLINDVLDFNKIQSGELELEKNQVNLNSLLNGIYQVFEFKAHEKGISLSFEIDESIPKYVETDTHRLSQIINNLLSNAVKFTNIGDVILKVEKLWTKGNQCRLRFLVRDTGIGISSENLDKIFLKFTQAESNTTRKYGGTGLGLNIADGLLKQFKSQLMVFSELNHGSVFSFVLNLEKSLTNEGLQLAETNSLHLLQLNFKGLKILLVEDFPVNTLVAKNLLENKGAQVYTAINGKEAVEIFKKKEFDCVLMDLQMPVMNGFEATKEIRCIEDKRRLQTTPVIALTASALLDIKEDAYKVGMDDFITKPFNPKDFYSKIFLCVERKKFHNPFLNKY